jgi:hypothetical protein
MMGGRFPEPRTFTARAAALLRARSFDFDVIHDNQALGFALVDLIDDGLPVLATVHHPLTVDEQHALASVDDPRFQRAIERWYGFVGMQKQVVTRMPRVLTVSAASGRDIVDHLGVHPDRLHIVPVGTDPDRFRPRPEIARRPGRILTTASADSPLKGLVHLVEALAKVRTERHADLVVVGKPVAVGPVAEAIDRYGLTDAVRFVHDITDDEFAELYAEAELAVVPSLYEGSRSPRARGDGLRGASGGLHRWRHPEVVGPDGGGGARPPGDAGAGPGDRRAVDDAPPGAHGGGRGGAGPSSASPGACAERTVEHYHAVRRDDAAGLTASGDLGPSGPPSGGRAGCRRPSVGGESLGQRTAFWILPALMHEVHTCALGRCR